jgi:hypothetical protein
LLAVVQAGKYWGSIVAVFLLGWGYEALKHEGGPAAIRLALSINTEVADDGKLYSSETTAAIIGGEATQSLAERCQPSRPTPCSREA